MNFITTSILPFLARAILGTIMLTLGWVNCFEQVEIHADMATDLVSMNISVSDSTSEDSLGYSTESTRLKSKTRGLNRIIWLINNRWSSIGSWGTVIATIISGAQILSGVLLLVGLFTRMAAVIILLTSVGSFYLISIEMHGMFLINPFEWPLDANRFMQLGSDLMLCYIALQLFFTGPGFLSLDSRHTNRLTSEEDKTEE